jgi:hypothetical protein
MIAAMRRDYFLALNQRCHLSQGLHRRLANRRFWRNTGLLMLANHIVTGLGICLRHFHRRSLLSAAGFLAGAAYWATRGEITLAWLFIITGISCPVTIGMTGFDRKEHASAGMLAAPFLLILRWGAYGAATGRLLASLVLSIFGIGRFARQG